MTDLKTWTLPIVLGAIIVILLLVLFMVPGKAPAPLNNSQNGGNTAPAPTTTLTEVGIPDLLAVYGPKPNDVVRSPLLISGKARGHWFFEASTPVKIYDANGQELGSVPVRALGNWMTADFVDFMGTLTFTAPTTDTGKLVFLKDNPSSLPQNEKRFEIPVRFK